MVMVSGLSLWEVRAFFVPMSIDPSAWISEEAVLGEGCLVGPFAVVERGVTVGRHSTLGAHAVLREGARVGERVWVDSFAVVGGCPQSFAFDPAVRSGVFVGDGAVLREGATVHRATEEGGETVVGANCYLMAQAHVAHDCDLGEGVVLCNNAMLGGHVHVSDKVFVGGGVGVHQFCRIGELAMIAGNASISVDVPPFVLAAERNELHGLNLVGLRRAGMGAEERKDLKGCYRQVFAGGGNLREKAASAERAGGCGRTERGRRFLRFFAGGKRGFARPKPEADA